MRSLHLWIAVLALTCFGCGVALGLFVERSARAQAGPGDDFERLFVAEFSLEGERRRLFEDLMHNYRSAVEEVRQRALADSLSEIEPQISALGRRYREWIRDRVLPEDQRPRFDALAQAAPWQP